MILDRLGKLGLLSQKVSLPDGAIRSSRRELMGKLVALGVVFGTAQFDHRCAAGDPRRKW